MKRLALGVAVSATLITLVAVFLASFFWNACGVNIGEKRFDPLRSDLWVTTSSGICTGFGGSSWASVEVGQSNTSEKKTIYIQDDADPPKISWTSRGAIEIHVDTTVGIRMSMTSVDSVPVEYVIPQSSTMESQERQLSNYETHSRADILAGKADFSGGDVRGNLKNLDQIVSRSQGDIERFVQWSVRVKARVE